MFGMHQCHSTSLVQRQSIRHNIIQDLKLSTSLLLKQMMNLRDEPPPDAIRGVDALRFADSFLRERDSVGLIIGGIAVELYTNGTPQQLQKHKDLDVMLVSGESPERFAGGVDWWDPSDHQISTNTGYSQIHVRTRCWKNGFGATLCFGAGVSGSVAPGLYLPPAEFLVDLLMHESTITVDVAVDPLALEIFEATLRETLLSGRTSSLIGKGIFGQLRSWGIMKSPMDPVAREVGLHCHPQDVWRKLNSGDDFERAANW